MSALRDIEMRLRDTISTLEDIRCIGGLPWLHWVMFSSWVEWGTSWCMWSAWYSVGGRTDTYATIILVADITRYSTLHEKINSTSKLQLQTPFTLLYFVIFRNISGIIFQVLLLKRFKYFRAEKSNCKISDVDPNTFPYLILCINGFLPQPMKFLSPPLNHPLQKLSLPPKVTGTWKVSALYF